MDLSLRPLEDGDLDDLFEWQRDGTAVAMAAFTSADPSDRAAFDAHRRRIRDDPSVLEFGVLRDGQLVGSVASFTIDGERELTYWIDPALWGRGIASAALTLFIREDATRPLFARVAEHNLGSITVLTRAGFVQVGSEVSYADGIGRAITEYIYRLDP